MQRDRKLQSALAVLLFGLWGVACQSSRPYKPDSDREAAVLKGATRTVYPDDVRQETGRHSKTLVAWPGIVRSFEVSREKNATVLRLDVEHRYFDWIEDDGFQPERYFLSPRGEGSFRAAWSLPLEVTASVPEKVHQGDLVLVYGYPAEVRDQVVELYPAEYVRIIGKGLYTDKLMDYGRRQGELPLKR